MIKTATKEIQTGAYTATPVYTKTGQMILSANTLLTAQQISRLEFYGIEWVNIKEPSDITEETDSPQPEESASYSQKVKKSEEFHTFKADFHEKSRYLESSFDDLLNKNLPVESRALIDQVSTLYADRLTSLSVFDMLHNMRQIDDTTFAHSINVALIGRMMGEWLGLSDEDLDVLTLAGLLHDIGKCTIDPNILLKPSSLTPKEYEEVKKHAVNGAEVLASQDLDERIVETARMHHERCDGSGYPSGLKDDEIPDFAKIIAIADVYDAMTSNRPYRKGYCPFEVIATFEREGLEKYDAEYILTFMTRILDTYMGNTVMLSDGTTGTVIMNNTVHYSRPLLRLSTGECIDLVKHPELYIQAII